jgi:hypothetical protein
MVPAKILLNHTKLAHVVEYKLGTQSLIRPLYEDPNWHEWKSFDTIHLLINHRAKMVKNSTVQEIDETNIWNYNRAYGRMVRAVLNKANLFIPSDNKYLND